MSDEPMTRVRIGLLLHKIQIYKNEFVDSTFIESIIFIIIMLYSISSYVMYSTVQLDDSFIYFRSIDNYLRTGDLSFNLGDSRNLMTSAGWFLTLVASKTVLPGADMVLTARVWSTLFLIGSATLLYSIFKDRLPAIAPFSPLPVFFMPSIPGLAGHETALALCMSLFLVWAFVGRRPILFPIAAAAAYLARGESAVFAVILGFAYLCSDGVSVNRLLKKARELAVGVALAAAIVGLWHGYHYLLTGSVFPETFAAKILQAESGLWPLFVWGIGTHLNNISGDVGLWVHVLSLFGLWVLWRHAWPLAIWALVHYLTLAGIGMPWYHWYYYPVEFAVITGLVAAGHDVARSVGKRLPALSGAMPRTVIILAVCIIAVGPLRHAMANTGNSFTDLVSLVRDGRRLPLPASRFAIYQEFAEWVKAHHREARDPVILCTEIGIVGYLAPRARVYDVVGLAAAAETPADMYDYDKQVGLHSPDYIIRNYVDEPPEALVFQSDSEQVRYVIRLTRRQIGRSINVALYSLDGS